MYDSLLSGDQITKVLTLLTEKAHRLWGTPGVGGWQGGHSVTLFRRARPNYPPAPESKKPQDQPPHMEITHRSP